MIVSLSLTSSPGRDKALSIVEGALRRGAYSTLTVQSNTWAHAARFLSTVIGKPIGYRIVVLSKSSTAYSVVIEKDGKILSDYLFRYFVERTDKGLYKYDKDGNQMTLHPMFVIELEKALEIVNAKADKAKK